jgi:thyroxine 5-deiodinase
LYADFSLVAGFLTVYISEAHSQDEWPMGDLVLLNQPTLLEDRCEIARQFVEDTNYMIPMVVDTMDNHFDKNFGVWPVRFFIVQNNHLVFKPQPSDFSYDLNEARRWLESRFC